MPDPISNGCLQTGSTATAGVTIYFSRFRAVKA